MKKILWRPPRLRIGEAVEGERHATWLELFYDLFFAAVVA
jgi:low temperature requirement protein LtrA